MFKTHTAFATGSLARLLRDNRGSAVVQQALFIALIVALALLSLEGLGIATQSTFIATTQGLASVDSGGDTAAGQSVVSRSSLGNVESSSIDGVTRMQWVVLLVACPFGAACWYLLHRSNKQKQTDEDLPEAPQTDSQVERDLVFDKRHNLLRIFNGDISLLMTSRVVVRHVMSNKVMSVSPRATVDEVGEIMRTQRFRHVLVCDQPGHLVGIITKRALEKQGAKTAADVMQPNPITVSSDAVLSPAITQLIKLRLYCLPVVDDGQLVGVLTTTDILMAMQCTMHALQRHRSEHDDYLSTDGEDEFSPLIDSPALA